MRSKILVLGLGFVFAVSCAPGAKSTTAEDENNVGHKLESVTGLRSVDGLQAQTVTLFDPTIKKIHQFDLSNMTWIKTVPVLIPSEKHYVLDAGDSNYIVDLSLKHLSIFSGNSEPLHNPVRFQGTPKSAAFRPDLGWLVIYDDLQSVGVLQLSPTGELQQSYVFGSIVDGDRSIVAGDLQDSGELILALSDSSVAVVNLQASLAAQPKSWVADIHTTTLKKINWLAPIPNHAGRILMKTADQVLLYDLGTKVVVQSLAVDSEDVIKLSKSFDPHVVVTEGSRSMKLIYSDGNNLLTRSFDLKDSVHSILSSDLDLRNDNWTYVFLKNHTGFSWFNDINQETDGRQLVRFRLSDKLALQNKAIDDKAQIRLSPNFVFALYPSVLGYAKKVSILGEEQSAISKFNLKRF